MSNRPIVAETSLRSLKSSMQECPKMRKKRLRGDVSATIGRLDTLPKVLFTLDNMYRLRSYSTIVITLTWEYC